MESKELSRAKSPGVAIVIRFFTFQDAKQST
jgi:hypothetical protein